MSAIEAGPERSTGKGWHFLVYIAGMTESARRTHHRLRTLLDRHLGPDAVVEIVDLTEDPGRAGREKILAIPTVVRIKPEPRRSVIGDLSDRSRAVDGLGLPPA